MTQPQQYTEDNLPERQKRRAFVRVLAAVFVLVLQAGAVWAATAEQSYYEGLRYLQETQQWFEAIRSFKDAVEADPKYWEAYEGLARAYDKAGDREKALEAAETSLDLHPDNPDLQKLADRLRPPVLNPVKPPVPSAKETWEFEMMGGAAFNNETTDVGLSFGLRVIRMMGPRWGLGATLDYQSTLSSSQADAGSSGAGQITLNTSNNFYAIDLLATVEYSLNEDPGLEPYAIAGLGFTRPGTSGTYYLNSNNPNVPSINTSYSNGGDVFAMAQGGVGVAYTAGDNVTLFLEGKANAVLTGNIYIFLPINAGIQFTL